MAQQQQDSTPKKAQAETAPASRPAAKFSGSGGLNVAVWKHQSENGPEHYSIRLDRTFKKDGGEYESTPYLREGDLLRARKLLDQVDNWIEQDKLKHRSRGSQNAAAAR